MHKVNETRRNAKKRRYEEFCDNSILSKHVNSLKRRCLRFVSGQSISTTSTSQNDVYLRTDAFKSMTNLRLLKVNYVKLTGRYDKLPKNLVWLSWHGFPLKTIPKEFPLENLVALDLSRSKLQQVWKETPFIESLKILDLSYSEWLERTPNFVGLPNLERLILKGCVSLVEVCESIGHLEMLDLLDLSNCKTLRKLPGNIGKLGSLRTLIISGCNISEFPNEMRNMKSLEELDANGIVINALHNISGEVKWWQPIVWSMVSTPIKGPESLWASLPCSLRILNLSGCNLSDSSFPVNFGNFPSLWMLHLTNNPFSSLPNCIKSLSGLENLNISGCNKLQSLELNGLPDENCSIEAHDCTSLEKITSIDMCLSLNLHGCSKLVEIENYFKNDGTEIIDRLGFTEDYDKETTVFEFGIFSIYAPSGAVPLFSSKKSEGSTISFTVPLLPMRGIQRLNVCCTYGSTRNDDPFFSRNTIECYSSVNFNKRDCCVSVKIENKTKDLTWIYRPCVSVKIENKTKDLTWIYRPKYITVWCHKDTEWLSQWRFGNQLEAGDEINITFDGEGKYDVKECGFRIVYHSDQVEEEEEENGGTTTIEKSHHDFPEFRLSTGEYFLCRSFKRIPDEDYWFPKDRKQLH